MRVLSLQPHLWRISLLQAREQITWTILIHSSFGLTSQSCCIMYISRRTRPKQPQDWAEVSKPSSWVIVWVFLSCSPTTEGRHRMVCLSEEGGFALPALRMRWTHTSSSPKTTVRYYNGAGVRISNLQVIYTQHLNRGSPVAFNETHSFCVYVPWLCLG